MTLNTNNTKALVATRSRTVNLRHGVLVLSGVSIHGSPNLVILGEKCTWQQAHLLWPCAWFCFSCLSENWYLEVGNACVFVDTYALLRCWCICSPNHWVLFLRCGGLLPNVTFSFSSARLCPVQSFLLLCHRIMLLDCVCCTRLICTVINVCSVSFHLAASTRVRHTRAAASDHISIVVWDIKVLNVQIWKVFKCRPMFVCGMTFRTLCLTSERWMGLWTQSTGGCFRELCFFQFSVAQVLVGLRKHKKSHLGLCCCL